MARSYGRVFPSIWKDEDFRAVSMEARLMYVFLVSQSDLDQAGVIPLRFRKWSGLLGISVKEVEELCAELDEARFTVSDPDTEELLVRSLIRRDEVWKQPNVFKAAATAAEGCESARLKTALWAEIRRLDLSGTTGGQEQVRADLLRALEPFGNPSPTPPRPSRDHSAGRSLAVVSEPEPGESVEVGSAAGHKGSARVPEGFADGTKLPRGKGKGIPVPETTIPLSPEAAPTPSPQAAGGDPSRDACEGDPGPGEEGENPGDRTPAAVTALVDEIRGIRPDWSVRSVRRAIDHPDVRDRPWVLVCVAFCIVAGDPPSRHPGRLAQDGDWWHAAARKLGLSTSARPADDRPEWCRKCDERTRFALDEFGQPGHLKCPDCHPDGQKARSA